MCKDSIFILISALGAKKKKKKNSCLSLGSQKNHKNQNVHVCVFVCMYLALTLSKSLLNFIF